MHFPSTGASVSATKHYCLDHELFNHIMGYIPAYPFLYSLRRVNKTWKHELENRVCKFLKKH